MFSFQNTVKKFKTQYLDSLEDVLDSGIGMLGPKVSLLESKLCDYSKANYCIWCQSGTFALTLALKALDIQPDDEVITTPFTWISSTSTIVQAGAIPVLVDIENDTYNIDITQIEKHITSKTKAILIVNIFGKLISNIDLLITLKQKYGLVIIEDAAQSFGAYQNNYLSCDGKIGDICCTSFYPTKPLSGFGDGGACFTNNTELANKLKLLRNHGMSSYGEIDILGWNARMNEFQAAIILINLEHFEEKTKNRLQIAKIYNEKINIKCIKPIIKEGDMVSQYCLLIDERDKFSDYLKKNNISYKIFYAKSITDQNLFKRFKKIELPICDKIKNSIISIPCYDTLEKIELEKIINVINKF